MGKNITELLNIEYPVIQGGMAWVADASLAAAVSNAGKDIFSLRREHRPSTDYIFVSPMRMVCPQ